MRRLTFEVAGNKSSGKKTFDIDKVIVIGLSGRDGEKVREHVEEVAALGIPSPKDVPALYYVAARMLTQDDEITCIGGETSGEVEFVILKRGEKIYIGLGSDHTDRVLEAVKLTKAKQVCEKPLCSTLWDYDDLRDHWDSLEMYAWQTVDGKEIPYQQGTTADILPVADLLAAARRETPDLENAIMFSGTIPTLAGFFYGQAFSCELRDKTLGRSLRLRYDQRVYPDYI